MIQFDRILRFRIRPGEKFARSQFAGSILRGSLEFPARTSIPTLRVIIPSILCREITFHLLHPFPPVQIQEITNIPGQPMITLHMLSESLPYLTRKSTLKSKRRKTSAN